MRVKPAPALLTALAKRLDGWQPGLAAVLVAWGAATIVVPREAAPTEIPEPMVTAHELSQIRAREARLASSARASLDPVLRALGSAIRDVGRAEASGDGRAIAEARAAVTERVAAVPPGSTGGLLALRAYQTEVFIEALRAWERGGDPSADLVELGGALVDSFGAAGWHVERDGRRSIALDDDRLGIAFRRRWAALASLSGEAVDPTLVEERLWLAFTLRDPRTEAVLRGDLRGAPTGAAQSLLRRIEAHARRDPAYPASFAKGVVYFVAGQHARAARAFEEHLRERPDGPLTLRAAAHARASMAAELGFSAAPSPRPR